MITSVLIWLRQKSVLAYVLYILRTKIGSREPAYPKYSLFIKATIAVRSCQDTQRHTFMMARGITKEQRLRKRQVRQRNERRISLMHKAYLYSNVCHADIFLGIRLRENGHVFTFQSDKLRFWSPMTQHLVGHYNIARFHIILTLAEILLPSASLHDIRRL